MNHATLTVKQLRGMLQCSAEQDVRYYLNGIYFNFCEGRAVSTDGHVLLAFNCESEGADPGYEDCIVSNDDIRQITKGGRADDKIVITHGPDNTIKRLRDPAYKRPKGVLIPGLKMNQTRTEDKLHASQTSFTVCSAIRPVHVHR